MYRGFFENRPEELNTILDILENEIWDKLPSSSHSTILENRQDYAVLTSLLFNELQGYMTDRNLCHIMMSLREEKRKNNG